MIGEDWEGALVPNAVVQPREQPQEAQDMGLSTPEPPREPSFWALEVALRCVFGGRVCRVVVNMGSVINLWVT